MNEQELRSLALQLALQHHHSTGVVPSGILKTAESFYNFLTNSVDKAPLPPVG